MRIGIGQRTVKTAVATGLAIAVAQWLGLQFYASVGIITILCVQPTRKKSYRSAWERFLGCVMGLLVSGLVFELLGYHPWSLTLLFLLLIPLTLQLKVTNVLFASTIIIFHVYTAKRFNMPLVLNELELIVIGVGLGLLVNLYMPNIDRQLEKHRQQIEQNFKKILHEFSVYLRAGESDWDGKEIIETVDMLEKAKALALRDLENRPFDRECGYYHYFEMREEQFEILERVMPIISSLENRYIQGIAIADFLDRLVEAVAPNNYGTVYLDELEKLRQLFKQQPLPVNREEFEIRAELYHFVNEMERYLKIKRDLLAEKAKFQFAGK